jgi:Tol biopolymer transport system component
MQGKLLRDSAWTLVHAARALVAAAVVVVATGCETNSTGPGGDASGERLVVYASDRNATAGQFDIYLYDMDNLGFRLLTLNSVIEPDLNPAITPEGRVVAFQAIRPGGMGGYDLYAFDRAAQVFAPLPNVNSGADETDPAFSSNGILMAFSQTASGWKQVRLINGLVDTLVALPGLNVPTANDFSPSPNSDASRIAFVSDRNGNDDVLVYDATGDSLFDLPDLVSDSTDTDPWLTPDGRYLAFASTRLGGAGGYDLYLYDLQTKAFVTLTAALNTDKTERNPSLSYDSNIIVFQSDRAGSVNNSMDLWNHARSDGSIGRHPQQSSGAVDMQPYLLWR